MSPVKSFQEYGDFKIKEDLQGVGELFLGSLSSDEL